MTCLVRQFFNGSAEHTVATLLDQKRSDLTECDLDHLSGSIEQARQEWR